MNQIVYLLFECFRDLISFVSVAAIVPQPEHRSQPGAADPTVAAAAVPTLGHSAATAASRPGAGAWRYLRPRGALHHQPPGTSLCHCYRCVHNSLTWSPSS